MQNDEIKQLVWKIALLNAVQHDGSARPEPVMGRLLSERPDLKERTKELFQLINGVVKEVNSIPVPEQRRQVEEEWPELLVEEKAKPEVRKLPPLPNIEKYPFVHVRFSPNPDGALHVGGCRAAILCDEYAKMYNGQFTLRFDDSDPRTKSPIPEAYDWIREDLHWLGLKWGAEVFQSDRLEVYYSYAESLIKMGKAYICTCNPVEFRKLSLAQRECPCRNLSPEEHLERWNRMLRGSYGEGTAVVRIKTDLLYPNPAVREWPAFRVIDTRKFPHPRTGDKYIVWPLFAFCSGIDDHDLKISHILRGKEHLTNSTRQSFLYNYFGWSYPEALHYGRFKMIETTLSKSKIREGITKGEYSGWDDPRLGTLRALKRRGFVPETLRQLILDVGPKPVDATISWDNIQAYNRKLLDPVTNRYFFVANPSQLLVNGVDKTYVAELPLHPSHPEKGKRVKKIVPINSQIRLLITENDLKLLKVGGMIRLMGLFNIIIRQVEPSLEAGFQSESYLDARKANAPLIHWIPDTSGVP
ncbi:MAG: glutamyl-tRNA synthetase, partial [Thermoproteota archaeon]|nr:glutamyl-tRNA synthetase [Thermoproteota archaeon]